MKIFISLVAALAVGMPVGAVAYDDVEMLPSRKRLERSKEREGSNTTKQEDELVYNVKVKSRSFKPLPVVKIKYNIFYEVTELGSTAKPEVKLAKGEHQLTDLQTNKPVEFDTEKVTLQKTALDGNWYFSNGGARVARDKVVGLWFKAFDAEGNLLGEYANPTTTSKKQKWTD